MLDCWSIAILLMSAARVRKRGNEEVKFSHQGFPLWRPPDLLLIILAHYILRIVGRM